ncbi:MAG: Rpn family recombination-promoting nuclease/putative transposase, partial [Hallerella porci]|uniref:Rpn family recombination-promoting nuclease/putative transposase n=1 Tax=Hallerella porci TaxID=1945871 RepID=UPI002A7FAB93
KKKSSDFKNDDETLEDLKKKLTRYELPKLYSIWICDFEIPELKEIAEYRDEFSLYSKNLIHHGNLKTLTPKNSYIIYELQKFSKTANKLVTAEDKWLYILKNAGSQTIPQFTDETFAAALNRIAVNDENENLLEKQEKEISMTEDIEYIRAHRVVAMVNAAEEKGEARGLSQGRAEEKYSLAKGFLKEGFPIETIAKVTGLSINEIKSL